MTTRHPSVSDAARRLARGRLVVHPTETVYGVGGLLTAAPLARLRRLKERPTGGFVVLIPSVGFVQGLLTPPALILARQFWPGPLTLVLDDREDRFPRAVKAPDGSIAVRVPGHPLTLDLLQVVERPISSTSANRPGERPATTARAAVEAVGLTGERDAVLDGGRLAGGPPSTLVRAVTSEVTILRRGAVDVLDLERALGSQLTEK